VVILLVVVGSSTLWTGPPIRSLQTHCHLDRTSWLAVTIKNLEVVIVIVVVVVVGCGGRGSGKRRREKEEERIWTIVF